MQYTNLANLPAPLVKTCTKCNETKPLSDFSKRAKSLDGYQPVCKSCFAIYYSRYARSSTGKLNIKRAISKWQSSNQQKRAAHVVLCNAVRDGRIIKTPCEKCGGTDRVHGHHENYAEPLEVTWLCHRCHRKHHKKVAA